ncbi:MAG: ABC transporter permease subunit [Candidatus Dormiibacterota bacterium]
MNPVLVIARLTARELLRRRLVHALLLLTVLVIGLTGWGFSRIPHLHLGGELLTPALAHLAAAQLLLLVMFMFSFVVGLTAAFLAAPAVAGDLESGIALAVLARPISRAQFLLGRWLGLAVPLLAYVALSASVEFLLVAVAAGYSPPNPAGAEAALGAEGLVLLSLTLLLSTRLSAMTAGVVTVVVFGAMWVAGVAGAFGQAFHNTSIAAVGDVSHLLVPSDGLWRAAIFAIQPKAFASASLSRVGSPFSASSGPSVAYLAFVAAWLLFVVGMGIVSLDRREI